jgi:tetrahydromethanopterin S-methyltransferase subunit G
MNEDYDISQVQVPDSFINQILETTSPMEKEVEETSIHESIPAAPIPAPVSNDGKIVELLTLMFEEFDKINSRFDSLQEKIDEMTTVGAIGVGPAKAQRTRKPEPKKDPLTALLAKKLKL